MFDLAAVCLSNVIILGFIAWYLSKKAKDFAGEFVENTKKDIKSELQEWINSEKGQKALYSIGAIIGHGAIAGSGFKKGGGKFKWEDLAAQVAGRFIEEKLLGVKSGEPARTGDSPPIA